MCLCYVTLVYHMRYLKRNHILYIQNRKDKTKNILKTWVVRWSLPKLVLKNGFKGMVYREHGNCYWWRSILCAEHFAERAAIHTYNDCFLIFRGKKALVVWMLAPPILIFIYFTALYATHTHQMFCTTSKMLWHKVFTPKVIMYHSLILPVLSLNSFSLEKPIHLDCLICKYWVCTTELPEGKSHLQKKKMFRLSILVEVSIHESTFYLIMLALLL